MDLFVLDAAGAVWTTEFDRGIGNWKSWIRLGANTFTAPGPITVVNSRPAGVSVFVHGIDGQVWTTYRDPQNLGPSANRGYRNWFALGPNDFPTPSKISAVSTVEGGLNLFTVGYDGKVWSTYFDPLYHQPGGPAEWQGWFSLKQKIFPRPGVVSAISTRPRAISLYTTDFDGAVWSANFEPSRGSWSKWYPIIDSVRVPAPATVTAVSSKANGSSLFVVTGKGGVLSAYFDPDNLGPPQQAGWNGWFPVGTPVAGVFPSTAKVRCIRLHIKILATPARTSISQMIASMDLVYRQCGVRVRHMGNEMLNLPLLLAVNVGDCLRTITTPIVTLFSNRNGVGPDDVVAYYVQSVLANGGGTFNGCALHPTGQNGATIASIASPWTLAHEVGHVLSLQHVDDPPPPDPAAPPLLDRLMTGRGTWKITNPPPDLASTEIATIAGHGLATDSIRP